MSGPIKFREAEMWAIYSANHEMQAVQTIADCKKANHKRKYKNFLLIYLRHQKSRVYIKSINQIIYCNKTR